MSRTPRPAQGHNPRRLLNASGRRAFRRTTRPRIRRCGVCVMSSARFLRAQDIAGELAKRRDEFPEERPTPDVRHLVAPPRRRDPRHRRPSWATETPGWSSASTVAQTHSLGRALQRRLGLSGVPSPMDEASDVGDQGPENRCSAFVANASDSERNRTLLRTPEVAFLPMNLVSEDGIEPPTRGFSILCSTN